MLSTIVRVSLVVAALLSVDVREARACSSLGPDPYIYVNSAPPGGLFVVRVGGETRSHDPEVPLAVTLVSGDVTSSVEIVRHVGVTLMVRVPLDHPLGPAMLTGVRSAATPDDWFFSSEYEPNLLVTEGSPPTGDAPFLDEIDTFMAQERVRGQAIVSFPPWSGDCQPLPLTLFHVVDRTTASAEISGPPVEETDFLVDVWVTDEGATLDVSTLPHIAGQSLYFLIDDASPTGTVRMPLPVDPGDTRDVHVRLTDPRTGLTSEIRTATVSVPDDEPMGVGCASTRCTTSGAPLHALVLGALALGFARRRRR